MKTIHRDATLTAEELQAEIAKTFELGPEGPGFCAYRYVGFASCERIDGHDGEHVSTGATGRLVAF
ncbi:hypothetical protein SEA_SNEK_59 [Arthrobacter phage Snek]|uniref:Uncharacterized protein n=2 Tax=Arthrobacter phage Tweety19 TaxID=2768133 RepID=A0A7G9W256_9CAUD|nr:hypothetical protein SEA_TWEETY19_60 [Arthrobacter phage Tweety19]